MLQGSYDGESKVVQGKPGSSLTSLFLILYSRKLSRGKTFVNFEVLWLFAKVFSVQFGGMASFGGTSEQSVKIFSANFYLPICESFFFVWLFRNGKRKESWEGRPRRRCMVLKYMITIWNFFVHVKLRIIIKSPASHHYNNTLIVSSCNLQGLISYSIATSPNYSEGRWSGFKLSLILGRCGLVPIL